MIWCQAYSLHTRDHGSVWIYQNIWRGHVVLCWRENAFEMVVSTGQWPQTVQCAAASWFQTNKIYIMKVPAQSLDLNPMETCGVTSKNAVSEEKTRNGVKLWNVVQSSWVGIPVHRYQKLVDSMQNRCEALLKNSRYTTKWNVQWYTGKINLWAFLSLYSKCLGWERKMQTLLSLCTA